MELPEPVELQLTPSCNDCLAWSEDGDLAVAAGEYVHTLLPKHKHEKSSRRGPGLQQWHHTKFQANLFTDEEWPVHETSNLEEFSIGEEQSTSTVSAISWSPPGLGRHRRSFLAVLTTNHLLSLWEMKREPNQWQRIAIINDSLKTDFSSASRFGTRIGAFAWSPPCTLGSSDGDDKAGPQNSRWGETFLVVANQMSQVMVLHIQHRHQREHHRLIFDVLSIPLTPISSAESRRSFLFTASDYASKNMRHLAWGPWEVEDRSICSLIAIVQGVQLKLVRATLVHEAGQFQLDLAEATKYYDLPSWPDLRLLGPAVWRHEVGSSCSLPTNRTGNFVCLAWPRLYNSSTWFTWSSHMHHFPPSSIPSTESLQQLQRSPSPQGRLRCSSR